MIHRYPIHPLFGYRRFIALGAVVALLGSAGCSGKDDEIEGITAGGADDDKSGIPGGTSKKKKKKSSGSKGKKGDMPDIPGGSKKKKKKKKGGEKDPDEGPGKLPCEIDFLFVIDHSGSMKSEQTNLQESVPEFIKTVKEEIDELEDYHIGVVTTGSVGFGGNFGSPGCQQIGALLTRTMGQNSSNRVCGPYANGKKFMTKGDDLEDKFVCAGKPGTSGSGDEKPMDALVAAVSKKLDTPACNAGFLRRQALLVVTIITDEEDDRADAQGATGSKGDPKDWYKAVVAAKGGDPKNVVVLGLVGTKDDNECDPLLKPEENLDVEGAQISERLVKFVKMFKKRGVVGDVCAKNYGDFFRKAVSVIDLACEEKPPV